jgi:hypothetical protein
MFQLQPDLDWGNLCKIPGLCVLEWVMLVLSIAGFVGLLLVAVRVMHRRCKGRSHTAIGRLVDDLVSVTGGAFHVALEVGRRVWALLGRVPLA